MGQRTKLNIFLLWRLHSDGQQEEVSAIKENGKSTKRLTEGLRDGRSFPEGSGHMETWGKGGASRRQGSVLGRFMSYTNTWRKGKDIFIFLESLRELSLSPHSCLKMALVSKWSLEAGGDVKVLV